MTSAPGAAAEEPGSLVRAEGNFNTARVSTAVQERAERVLADRWRPPLTSSASSPPPQLAHQSGGAVSSRTAAPANEPAMRLRGCGGRISARDVRFATASLTRRLHNGLHTHRTLDIEEIVLNRKRRRAALLQSPLPDSNRRPPPYHAI